MNNDQSILIVLPTLNSYQLLDRLINSLRSQSFELWRLLFIDGNSSEEHIKCLNKFSINDNRISWIEQDPNEKGIFGAMNQGFKLAKDSEWILFWGSDDYATNSNVLLNIINAINNSYIIEETSPDIIVFWAQYINLSNGIKGRKSKFCRGNKFLTSKQYRLHLLTGCAPPHQGTIFSPKIRRLRCDYDRQFNLSADLDYFLQISKIGLLKVQIVDIAICLMGDEGVSGRRTLQRLNEVRIAYSRAFGRFWMFPVIARYFRRLLSLLIFRLNTFHQKNDFIKQ